MMGFQVNMEEIGHVATMQSSECAEGDKPRKLAILGLPWDTSDESLRMYFAKFGMLDGAEIMRDRYTGKSRGFGFVTFNDANAAERVLTTEHLIDGRRCEAKVALPKGEPNGMRTTRIFVARIPASVTEAQFRAYFEKFGKLADAYMPKDHTKQGYRGIGFVTFASPDSVEKVMTVKHWINGHEVAIDRANPKDDGNAAKPAQSNLTQRRSLDNGVNMMNPGLGALVGFGAGFPTMQMPEATGPSYTTLRSLSEERENSPSMTPVSRGLEVVEMRDGSQMNGMQGPPGSRPLPHGAAMGLAMNMQALSMAQQSAASQAAISHLAKQTAALHSASMGLAMPQLSPLTAGLPLNSDISVSIINNAFNKPGQQYLRDVMALQSPNGSGSLQPPLVSAPSKRMDPNAAAKRGENPAILNARAGPRLFVGKLTKDTSEVDVKEYFQRFGYVMDVYLPKSKDNKAEHRGFGFVTFETEAAIQRVVAHGPHRLKGSTIAIDIAMPKVEDADLGMEGAVEQHMAAPVLKDHYHSHPLHHQVPLEHLAWVWPCMTPNALG